MMRIPVIALLAFLISGGSSATGTIELEIRPVRPVMLQWEPMYVLLSFTNRSMETVPIDALYIEKGRRLKIFVSANGGPYREMKQKIVSGFFKEPGVPVAPGETLEVKRLVNADMGGFHLTEPGLYTLKAVYTERGQIESGTCSVQVVPPPAELSVQAGPFSAPAVAQFLSSGVAEDIDSLRAAVEALSSATPPSVYSTYGTYLHAELSPTFDMIDGRKEDYAKAEQLYRKTLERAESAPFALADQVRVALGHLLLNMGGKWEEGSEILRGVADGRSGPKTLSQIRARALVAESDPSGQQ